MILWVGKYFSSQFATEIICKLHIYRHINIYEIEGSHILVVLGGGSILNIER